MIGVNNELYGTVRSNLLSQEPLPSLNRAYQTLIQEESVHGISRETVEREEVSCFVVKTVRGKGQFEKKEKANLLCSHCGKDGHDKDHCFLIVGFLMWWGDRLRNRGRETGKGRGIAGTTTMIQNCTWKRRSGAC